MDIEKNTGKKLMHLRYGAGDEWWMSNFALNVRERITWRNANEYFARDLTLNVRHKLTRSQWYHVMHIISSNSNIHISICKILCIYARIHTHVTIWNSFFSWHAYPKIRMVLSPWLYQRPETPLLDRDRRCGVPLSSSISIPYHFDLPPARPGSSWFFLLFQLGMHWIHPWSPWWIPQLTICVSSISIPYHSGLTPARPGPSCCHFFYMEWVELSVACKCSPCFPCRLPGWCQPICAFDHHIVTVVADNRAESEESVPRQFLVILRAQPAKRRNNTQC